MAGHHNLHVPLDEAAWLALRAESARSRIPATALARLAIDRLLRERERQRIRDQVEAFARAYAGTTLDLDPALESASLEAIVEPG